MRVLLFTGKGGVGKTTAAAGTAALAAQRGLKTLVLSTDAAHSLADAFAVALPAGRPVEVEPGLFVQQVESQRRFERSWGELQGYLLSLLDASGVDPIEAEELTVLPGAEEILALLEVRDQVRSGRWDLVVVDCAPTGETLRLLALPEALGWYLRRVFPVESRVVRSLRPVLGAAYGAGEPVGFAALAGLAERMYGEGDPVAVPSAADLLTVERSGDEFVLSLALPLADRDDTELARRGDELVVTVGGSRRVIALPSALRRCTVVGAALRNGRLRIRFEPDPELWRGL